MTIETTDPLAECCKTCATFKDRLNNPSDPLAGTHKRCASDRRNPKARYTNPDLACRFNPSRWEPIC